MGFQFGFSNSGSGSYFNYFRPDNNDTSGAIDSGGSQSWQDWVEWGLGIAEDAISIWDRSTHRDDPPAPNYPLFGEPTSSQHLYAGDQSLIWLILIGLFGVLFITRRR